MSLTTLIRKPHRLPSILKISKYGSTSSSNEISPDLKDLSSPLPYAKTINFDLNNKNITSIEDLDVCNGFLTNTEDLQSSSASTMAGSRLSVETKTFSKGHSLMTELEVCDEEETIESSRPLRLKAEDGIMNEQVQDISFEPQTTDKSVIGFKEDYKHIRPTFNSEGTYASSYAFSVDKKTVTHVTAGRFSAIFADEPLPNAGKVKFSVKVEACEKGNPRLYVGVASHEQKDKQLGYKAGWYFVSAFSSESYLNGLKTLKQDAFARQGQVISVLADMDEKIILFELDGVEILKGKLIVQKNKVTEFYPCISLGEVDGTVGFV